MEARCQSAACNDFVPLMMIISHLGSKRVKLVRSIASKLQPSSPGLAVEGAQLCVRSPDPNEQQQQHCRRSALSVQLAERSTQNANSKSGLWRVF